MEDGKLIDIGVRFRGHYGQEADSHLENLNDVMARHLENKWKLRRDEAEELAQEILIELLRNPSRWPDSFDQFRSNAFSRAIKRSFTVLRNRVKTSHAELDADTMGATEPEPEAPVDFQERLAAVLVDFPEHLAWMARVWHDGRTDALRAAERGIPVKELLNWKKQLKRELKAALARMGASSELFLRLDR